MLVLAIASGLLLLSIVSLSTRNISRHLPHLWELGFGALTPWTFIHIGLPHNDPAGLISNVLVANLPQFILSVLYLFYNGMISTFLVQREFSRMKNVTTRHSERKLLHLLAIEIRYPSLYHICDHALAGLAKSIPCANYCFLSKRRR